MERPAKSGYSLEGLCKKTEKTEANAKSTWSFLSEAALILGILKKNNTEIWLNAF